jgi:glycosyltransferase involved in cell wall biosynthesis
MEFSRAHRILTQATVIISGSATNLEWGLRLAKRNARPGDKWFPLASPGNSNDKGDIPGNNLKAIMDKLDIGNAPFVIIFAGSFSTAFNLRTVIDVARGFLLSGERRIMFILIGDGVQLSTLRNLSSGLKNIVLTGWLDKSSIDDILKISSIGLAPYSSGRLITLPNKPFEYMAAGLPILSSLEGELKTIIKQESIGLQYKAGDCNDLKDKIMWFLSHPEEMRAMGRRAKALFERKYNADVVYPCLVKHLTKIAGNGHQINEWQ